MGFQQGLSGLNAASKGLDVIGHNIANANTTGMKSSRAEFAELYASSLGFGGVSTGIGVTVDDVSQQFSQGNLSITGNDLDLAINGNGFFTLNLPDNSTAYTRDGTFGLDKNGYIVNAAGAKLMGYATDTTGNRTSTVTQALQLPTGAASPPKATTSISIEANLNASAPIASSVTPPTPVTTYGTSLLVYDQQGLTVPVGLFFSKTAANTWEVYTSYNGAAPTDTGTAITFQADGTLDATNLAALNGIVLQVPDPQDPTGATLLATQPVINASSATFTQYNNAFVVSKLQQDGYQAGSLTGIKIEDNGVITARYSNGQTQSAGQVALANFANVQGLAPVGGNNWVETFASGQPLIGAPGEGKLGALKSGALEDSNVDLTQELVNMMTAQRAYQANAQTIKTQDQVMSTLVNLR